MPPVYKLMDSLLLSADPSQLLAWRTMAKIEKDFADRLRLRAPPQEKLDRLVAVDVLARIEQNGTVACRPTTTSIERFFAESRKVMEALRISEPFKGPLIEEIAHWFDDYFSPGSAMMKRVAELGLPGVEMPGGTKWRAAVCVLEAWNQPLLCNYLSLLLPRRAAEPPAMDGHES